MRWQQLFTDLQAQFEEEVAAGERAEVASRTRAEIGAVRLADRLRGAVGTPLALHCGAAGQVGGVLVDVGTDWVLLDDDLGREVLLATAVVRSVTGLGRRTAPLVEAGHVRSRLDLRRALRGLARDRAVVQIVLDDGVVLAGTLDRVGADYVDLAEHAVDVPRRAEAVSGVRAVVIAAVAIVRTVAPGI